MPGETFSMLEAVKNLIPSDWSDKLGSELGESPTDVKQGLRSVVPLLLGAFATKGSTESGAHDILGMIRSQHFQGTLSTLFGGKTDAVTQGIAQRTGLRKDSVLSLMTAVVPFIMKVIGDRTNGGEGGVQSLMNLFSQQKAAIMAALPAGLGAFLVGAGTTVTQLGERAKAATRSDKQWILPAVIFAVLALGGLWYFNRDRALTRAAKEDAAAIVTKAETVASDASDKLTALIKSGTIEGPGNRIAFSKMTFNFGTAELTPESEGEIRKVVEVLKQYPNVAIRIEGHTDGVGDVASNKQLSLNRATAVREKLASQGIAIDRIEVAGWGDEHPVASNATEAGRAQNRRIEVVVLRGEGGEAPAH